MKSEERAERIIQIVIRLIEVLDYENTSLEEGKVSKIKDILAEKEVLMENYEGHIKYLEKHPNFSREISEVRLGELVQVGSLLTDSLRDNEYLLKVSSEAGEMLLSSFIEAADKMNGQLTSYKSTGETASSKDTKNISLAIDKTL